MNENTDYDLKTAVIERDDIDQEAQIFEWKNPGKKANRRIIEQTLTNQADGRKGAVVFFGDYDQSALNEAKDPWANQKIPIEVIEYIVEFALSQSEYMSGLIFEFLDTQDESLLDKIREMLSFFGNTSEQVGNPKKPKKVSIVDILRKSLPLTIDEMIELATRVSPETKRPAATVRQAIRDAKKRGSLVVDEERGLVHEL